MAIESKWPFGVSAEVLRAWRLSLGISQRGLARLLGVGVSLIRYNEQRKELRAYAEKWKTENPAKISAYSKIWCDANREKCRTQSREWARNNKERARARSDAWYLANRDHVQEKHRAWKLANPERNKALIQKWRNANKLKRRKQGRAWRARNREKTRAFVRQWQRNNPEKVLANTRNRRARKLGASGICSATQALARIAFYGGMCAYCQVMPHEHLDHVIPLSRGGTNWPANLRPSCEFCNLSKSNKTFHEWRNA